MVSLVDSTACLEENFIPILHKNLSQIEKEKTCPSSFYEMDISLTPKSGKISLNTHTDAVHVNILKDMLFHVSQPDLLRWRERL